MTARLVQTPTSGVRALKETPVGDVFAAGGGIGPAILKEKVSYTAKVEGPQDYCFMLYGICSLRGVCGKK